MGKIKNFLLFCFSSILHYLCTLKDKNNTTSVKISKVIAALERFAPLPLQESYDNAGLQVGLTEVEVSGALLCLDVTEQIVDEAVRKGCNLIVSHHPLIFHKLARIGNGSYVERTVMAAIRHGITIVSWHTNLDSATGGTNFKMANKLRLSDVRLVATAAGGDIHTVNGVDAATLVMGNLPKPLDSHEFIDLLKSTFNVACVQTNELLRRPICTVALCGGAGSFLINDALKVGADAFVTGEAHYHEFFGMEQQMQIAVIGHYQSEQYNSELLRDIIAQECPGVKTHITEINTNPILYI